MVEGTTLAETDPTLRPPDKSIPVAEIVDSFDVFHTGQGSQGLLERPSNQELETVFGTHNSTDIVLVMLEKGRIISSDGPVKFGSKNQAHAGTAQTSRGAVGGGR